jgi:hypothetical protein
MENDNYIKHIKFLLIFADYVMPKQPERGLDPTFYLTGKYESDMGLWDLIQMIKEDVK